MKNFKTKIYLIDFNDNQLKRLKKNLRMLNLFMKKKISSKIYSCNAVIGITQIFNKEGIIKN